MRPPRRPSSYSKRIIFEWRYSSQSLPKGADRFRSCRSGSIPRIGEGDVPADRLRNIDRKMNLLVIGGEHAPLAKLNA